MQRSVRDIKVAVLNRVPEQHAYCCFAYNHQSTLFLASEAYAVGLFLSVSVSACLSQVVVLLKRLNVRLRKQRRTIAQGL